MCFPVCSMCGRGLLSHAHTHTHVHGMDSVFSVTETGQPWQEGLLRPQAAHREEFSQEEAELAPGSPWRLEVTASFMRVIRHEGHVSHLPLCDRLWGTAPGEWKLELVRVICPSYHPQFRLLPVVWPVVGREWDWPLREDFDNTEFPVLEEWPWVAVVARPWHCCFTARGSGQASRPVPTPRARCFQQPGVSATWFSFVAWVSRVHPLPNPQSAVIRREGWWYWSLDYVWTPMMCQALSHTLLALCYLLYRWRNSGSEKHLPRLYGWWGAAGGFEPRSLDSKISFYHSGQPPHVALWERTRLPVQETWEMWVQSLGQEDALEKEMATHSSILAWRIPWPEEPGGL